MAFVVRWTLSCLSWNVSVLGDEGHESLWHCLQVSGQKQKQMHHHRHSLERVCVWR